MTFVAINATYISLFTGEIFARLDALEGATTKADQRLDSVAQDIHAIRSTLDQARGGWKVLVVVGGAVAALSAAIAGAVVRWLGYAG